MDVLTLSNPHLVELLKNGGVGVLPTDTVYGLVCVAANADAVRKLYAYKQREKKPGIIIAAHRDQVCTLGISSEDIGRVERFWPGVSIILPADARFTYVHQGLGTLAVRVVADQTLREFLEKTGPLLTSSANLPGQSPANTIDEARAYFEEAVDFYVDGGDLSGRQSSTLIRVVDGVPEILRQG